MRFAIRSSVLAALLTGMMGSAVAQQLLQLSRQDQKPIAAAVYSPGGADCQGIAIISPGAGGSETGYRYLGEAFASLGYLALVVGHPESGRGAVRERMRSGGLREGLADLITHPEAYRGRFMDIAAARAWAQGRCKGAQALLVGHSMGAATVMMEAGADNKVGLKGANAFDAYIALSPQGAGLIFPEKAWSTVAKPVLMLTGTRDTELGGGSWETRTEPFKGMPPGCKWLGVIDGATHMHFAGSGASRRTEALTVSTIEAFLAGVQRGDCKGAYGAEGLVLSTR